MADNLGLITNLLQDAFDADGIAQLAFAEFRAVYDDFTPGMTNSQRIRMIVDHALTRAYTRVVKLNSPFAHLHLPDYLGLGLAFTYALARTFENSFDLDLDHALDLDLALTTILKYKNPIVRARALAYARVLSSESQVLEIHPALQMLSVPGADPKRSARDKFKEDLEEIIANHFDLSGLAYLIRWDERHEQFIQSIDLDKDQINLLTGYLKGTALLADCLKMATVTDREGIEARLLLPAAQEKGS